MAIRKGNELGFEVTAKEADEDDDDSETEDGTTDELDETALESYTTPIDNDDEPECIDEYITFQQVISSTLCYVIVFLCINI